MESLNDYLGNFFRKLGRAPIRHSDRVLKTAEDHLERQDFKLAKRMAMRALDYALEEMESWCGEDFSFAPPPNVTDEKILGALSRYYEKDSYKFVRRDRSAENSSEHLAYEFKSASGKTKIVHVVRCYECGSKVKNALRFKVQNK